MACVYAEAAAVTVALCRITGNTATNNGGGVYCAYGASLFSCLIAYNTATNMGGGLYHSSGTAHNGTIASNTAALGGGVHVVNGTLINSIVQHNTAASNANWSVGGESAKVLYSSTSPTNGLPDGRACRMDDPLFVDALEFRLQDGSPCIDAGTNLPWTATAFDLDGNPRLHGGRVDMGCYEFIPEPACVLVLAMLAVLENRTYWTNRTYFPGQPN